MRGLRFTLAALLALAGAARAEVFDRIEIRPVDGAAEVYVGLTVPVRYVRHFPQSSGQIIEVFFEPATIDGRGPERPAVLIPEIKRSPRSDLVPAFTLTWNPKLTDARPAPTDAERERLRVTIQFEKPVDFEFVEGRDNRSFSLLVKHPAEGNTAK